MKKVFILQHVYEKDDREEVKFIWVFSTQANADKAIEALESMPGFGNLPVECFQMSEAIIDHYERKEWFITWDEAIKDI